MNESQTALSPSSLLWLKARQGILPLGGRKPKLRGRREAQRGGKLPREQRCFLEVPSGTLHCCHLLCVRALGSTGPRFHESPFSSSLALLSWDIAHPFLCSNANVVYDVDLFVLAVSSLAHGTLRVLLSGIVEIWCEPPGSWPLMVNLLTRTCRPFLADDGSLNCQSLKITLGVRI